VRDDAANAFAKAFYEAMLGGASFGRALRDARQENARRFPDCNTWGAYQAYGDPDFKLNPKGDGPAHSTDIPAFVAAEELINELARLRQQSAEARRAETAEADGKPARRSRRNSVPDMLTRIRNLVDGCPPQWWERGDVLTAFGETYGELGAAGFEQAVDYYTRALAVEDPEGRVPLTVIEQLANLEARHGARTQPPRPELIARAIARLQGLLALSPNAERLRLMASAYKRLAQVAATPADTRAAVEESAAYYEKASRLYLERTAIDPYSVLNWLACRAVLGQPAPEAETWLSRCEAAASERFARSRGFWDAVIRPDAAVLRHLLKGSLATAEDDLVARYTEVREEAQATPREFDSVLDQLGFIASMVDKIGMATGPGTSPDAALKRIRARLAGDRLLPDGAGK
jgi:tetratricopeptide (TPR) repeat protein